MLYFVFELKVFLLDNVINLRVRYQLEFYETDPFQRDCEIRNNHVERVILGRVTGCRQKFSFAPKSFLSLRLNKSSLHLYANNAVQELRTTGFWKLPTRGRSQAVAGCYVTY